MIKRGESPQDPWSGQMAFPGGHASPQDRSLFDTAAREAQEEIWIDAHVQRFLGCLDNVYPRNHPMIIAPFVFVLTNIINPKTSREAKEIVWVPTSFLLDPKNVSSLPLTIRGKEISVPCYSYANHMIWGISFRIIRELLANMKTRG